MKDSKYQLDVYEAVEEETCDIVVKATAGSGKTTTIVKASTLIPKHKDTIFLAFNKSIVEELRERLPDNVNCSTLHSLGFRTLFGHYRSEQIKVSSYKTINFVDKVLKTEKVDPKEVSKMKWVVSNMMDFARLNHIPNEERDLIEVSDYYGIVFENKDLEIARKVYEEIFEYNDKKTAKIKYIDYVDMIYIPSFYDVRTPKYDVIFVDEAQDLNKSQQILIQKIKKPGGRAIYVGDENQAIYRFAGADANSFDTLNNKETISLPLSVCYRCAKNIVKEAQNVVGAQAIEPFEGQIDGVVRKSPWTEIREGDMVVCRNNAPLFSLYFDLLSEGIKATIKGKEIEKQLINVVEKIQYLSIEAGLNKVEEQREKIYDDLVKKGVANPSSHKRLLSFVEIQNIITFLSDGKDIMLDVLNTLREIFDEDKEGATLMTIHKSKGLENKRVFFLLPSLIPSKWATEPEELIQEKNLYFVAVTRAKEELHYIEKYQSRIDI